MSNFKAILRDFRQLKRTQSNLNSPGPVYEFLRTSCRTDLGEWQIDHCSQHGNTTQAPI